jgi:hypothetical protein
MFEALDHNFNIIYKQEVLGRTSDVYISLGFSVYITGLMGTIH